MEVKLSAVKHDLKSLKERFPHVKDKTIIQRYKEIFRKMARGAQIKDFIPLLAKRYTVEELAKEYPAAEKTVESPAKESALQEQKPEKRSVFFKFISSLKPGKLAENRKLELS